MFVNFGKLLSKSANTSPHHTHTAKSLPEIPGHSWKFTDREVRDTPAFGPNVSCLPLFRKRPRPDCGILGLRPIGSVSANYSPYSKKRILIRILHPYMI